MKAQSIHYLISIKRCTITTETLWTVLKIWTRCRWIGSTY